MRDVKVAEFRHPERYLAPMAEWLIHGPDAAAEVDDRLRPLLQVEQERCVPWPMDTGRLRPDDRVIAYLDDTRLKELLPGLTQAGAQLYVLPHPGAPMAAAAFGVKRSLEGAVEHLRSEPGGLEVDLLHVNGRPVLGSVVLGRSFLLMGPVPGRGPMTRLRALSDRILRTRPFSITMVVNERTIATALSGMVVAKHGLRWPLTRMLDGALHAANGMLEMVLLHPRSMLAVLGYTVGALFGKPRLPAFVSLIRTSRVQLSSPLGLPVEVDGERSTPKELLLEVQRKALRLLPGPDLDLVEEGGTSDTVMKVSRLPIGEAAEELARGPLPFIAKASTGEFKELFQVLRENAKPRTPYLVLMALSTLLATFGLFADSSPVVIGAMILAPLMAPIISLSMATLRHDRALLVNSALTILVGLAIALTCSVLITLVTPIDVAGQEILARTRPNLLDLGIAVVSGMAGAYAHAREEVARTLAGVAIAVALVPPLAVAGIGLGWMDAEVFLGAGLLLLTNLAGIVLAAALTFLVLGFGPLRMATRGLWLTLVSVAVLSIPLAIGFGRMMQEHQVIRDLNGWQAGDVVVKEVKVLRLNPMSLSVKVVGSGPLDDAGMAVVKRRVQERLGCSVSLEVVQATRM